MRPIASLLFFFLVLFIIGTVFADEELPISGILNPDSASQIGSISTLNEFGEEGVFVVTPDGQLAISMLRDEIVAASHEHLGGFLSVYAESGQALFELPDGGYQMQLTTTNGTINFSYLNQYSNIESAALLTMEEDWLLQTSPDNFYQFYLLTTGELRVTIGPDTDSISYHLTFTGIPALNIVESSAN